MAAFNFHRRRTRRGWYVGAATLAIAALFAVVFVASSGAIVSGSPSNFESLDALNNANPPVPDGNMTNDVSGNSDWNCFAGHDGFHSPASDITGTSNCSSSLNTSAGFTATDPAATTSDDSWVNGTKFDNSCEPVGTNKNPGKDDFINIASYSEVKSSNKNQYLYGATIRYTANGSASENVELNQVAGTLSCPITRTAGDHLLAFDYNSGGKVLNLHVLTWIDANNPNLGNNNGVCIVKTDPLPCWGATVITPNSDTYEGDTNASAIPKGKNAISYADLVAGQFAEFGVNLTTALSQDTTKCNTTSQIDWESRSSGSSFSSNPEDLSIEHSTISNCGRIIIHKQTSPRGVDQAFAFNSDIPNPTDATVTSSSSPYCQGDTTPNGTAGFSLNDKNNANKATSVNDATNTEDCQNVVQNTYHVTEQTQSGFVLSNIVCTTPTGGASSVTYGSGGGSSFTAGDKVANITLKPNETVECTYTNTQNSATLTTAASSSSVFPATSVTDTATVTGSQSSLTPTGNVTFYLCSSTTTTLTGCSSSDQSRVQVGSPVALTGSGATATATSAAVNTSLNPLGAGSYCFEASWPGSTDYPGSKDDTSGDSGAECFTVSQIGTTTTTTPSPTGGTTTFGDQTVTDHAVVAAAASGGGTPTGSVKFYLCSPSDLAAANSGQGEASCVTGGTQVGSAVTTVVSNPATTPPSSTADSSAFTNSGNGVNQVGKWCWRAEYTPGGTNGNNYTGSSDSSAGECFTVTDTTNSSSAQTWFPNDSASVSAQHGESISGTLTIQLYTGNNCGATSGAAVNGQSYSSGDTTGTSITVDSKTAGAWQTSYGVSKVTPTAAQAFSWKVSFASDNTALIGNSSHCESSSLTITD